MMHPEVPLPLQLRIVKNIEELDRSGHLAWYIANHTKGSPHFDIECHLVSGVRLGMNQGFHGEHIHYHLNIHNDDREMYHKHHTISSHRHLGIVSDPYVAATLKDLYDRVRERLRSLVNNKSNVFKELLSAVDELP